LPEGIVLDADRQQASLGFGKAGIFVSILQKGIITSPIRPAAKDKAAGAALILMIEQQAARGGRGGGAAGFRHREPARGGCGADPHLARAAIQVQGRGDRGAAEAQARPVAADQLQLPGGGVRGWIGEQPQHRQIHPWPRQAEGLIRQAQQAIIGLVESGIDQIGEIRLRRNGVAHKAGAQLLAAFGGGFGHGESGDGETEELDQALGLRPAAASGPGVEV
jgi:hypothetical protein